MWALSVGVAAVLEEVLVSVLVLVLVLALVSVLVLVLVRKAFARPFLGRAWAQSVVTVSAPSVARSASQQTVARGAQVVVGVRRKKNLTTHLAGAAH